MRARAGWSGAARAAGGTSYIPWRKSSHRGLQLAERTTRIHADDAGLWAGVGSGTAPAERRASRHRRGRGRRSGRTGGEPGAGAAIRYTPRRRWRRTRADAAAVPVRTGAGAAAPVEDRGRRTSRGPQSESWADCGAAGARNSDGRDLRFAGLVRHAGPHRSTAPMEQGERCGPDAVGSG